ncbi:MAG: aldo/keto reductase [Trueperaceae bacterium]|nr:aldo/keto reductase [Trueperaceae bacterium]
MKLNDDPNRGMPASTKVALGRTRIEVSRIGLGTSALGGEFGAVSEADAVATVHAALAAGINLFDTAPAYGATASESRLGLALAGFDRSSFVLSTKAGKTLDDAGRAVFDYSEDALRRSVDLSAERLGVDVIDIVHLHDFDYASRRHVEAALTTGFETLRSLQQEGRIRAVGAGIYPLDLWKRVLCEVDPDVILLHNHHTLCDVRAYELLPLTEELGTGVINAAPFASGLLSGREAPEWHPAGKAERALFARAAALAGVRGAQLAPLALSFSASEPRLPITLFSCSSPQELQANLDWVREVPDRQLIAEVQQLLESVMNRQWDYGGSLLPPYGGTAISAAPSTPSKGSPV